MSALYNFDSCYRSRQWEYEGSVIQRENCVGRLDRQHWELGYVDYKLAGVHKHTIPFAPKVESNELWM